MINQQLPAKTSNTEGVFLMFDHLEVQCVVIPYLVQCMANF